MQQFSDFRPTAARLDSLDLRYGYRRFALKTVFFPDHPDAVQRSSHLYSQYVHLRQRRPAFGEGGVLLEDARTVVTDFYAVGYETELRRTINPLGYGVKLELRDGGVGTGFATTLRLEAELSGGYQYRQDRFLRWRFFAGYFLTHGDRGGNTSPATSFSLVDNAASDYRYDDLYLGRNRDDGGYGQQLERRQGGFRAPVAAAFTYGRSNDYLGAVNLDADLPLPIPLGVYFDAGTYGFRPTIGSEQRNQFNYVAGLSINILRDALQLHVPLIADNDTRLLLEQRGNLLDRMTLRLNLHGAMPWQWMDEVNGW